MSDSTTIDISRLSGVGQLLTRAAEMWPAHAAVAEPFGSKWKSVTFRQLESASCRQALHLTRHGVFPGKRMALMVPPGIQFVSLVFALFKTGATTILIDPGMGRKNLVTCLSSAGPDGMVGIGKAQLARWVFRKQFPDTRLNFVCNGRWWPGCISLGTEIASASCRSQGGALPPIQPADAAAIIFTSGSTGPPKGVCYTHANFLTQAIEIRDWFGIEPGGADISGFPLFALFNTAMGKTTVFPKMDFTRPARVDPRKFFCAVEQFSADQSFGSPALWTTVGRWAKQNKRSLPTIRRVMSAGAPVPAHVLKITRQLIAADGEVYTPYGATEALPVACNSASVVLAETSEKTDRGWGVCVGSRFARIRWMIIAITDQPIQEIGDVVEVAQGEIGELVVSGPVVTQQYLNNPAANELAKIREGDVFWHRMGDVGRMDEHNRFWFCGRKSQRVVTALGTLYTVPCESIINTHPAIYRSALVGIGTRGSQIPVIVAEPWPEFWPVRKNGCSRLLKELGELAGRSELTGEIRHILLKRRLPVDIRHNSKIFREQIRQWVADRHSVSLK